MDKSQTLLAGDTGQCLSRQLEQLLIIGYIAAVNWLDGFAQI